ncbi:MAG: PQQ-binding-like beta-propeller repeat protein [Alphaproteobacteria bacterium]|nr:PQQ-binding-like beta-propeller repeat protein [Alphaproteobacteria bacterium]
MRRFGRLAAGAALLALTAGGPAVAGSQRPDWTVTKRIALGAPDRWDYLTFDPDSGRLYVSHGDRVAVVDGRTGALLGNVTGMPGGTHGIAISHATDQGFTDDGRAGEAVAFDLKTLKVVKRIKAEPDADGIIFDPASGHVFVIDGDSGRLTAIDPKTDRVLATIDGGGGLEFGVSGDNGKLYVNGAEKHEIVRIDTATEMADAHWPMPACARPHGLAIDRAHHRLFSTCANKIMVVMNADDGAVIANLPIAAGSDAAAFDPVRGLAFSSNFSGSLSVVAEQTPDKFVALPAVHTMLGARTMTLDPKNGRIYLVAADIAVNPSAAATDYRHRYKVKPGSVTLYFMDPAKPAR